MNISNNEDKGVLSSLQPKTMHTDSELDLSDLSPSDSDYDKTYSPNEEFKRRKQREFSSSEDETYQALVIRVKKVKLSFDHRPISTAGACD